MKNFNLRRILSSLFSVGIIAILAIVVTNAFFSDSETSLGNTFVAGDIDLQIDNESYAIDWNIPGFQNPQGNFVASSHTSWTLKDLTVEKFFDFVDLKPGDYGEDTISIHVGSNDAWMCAAARITEDQDNSCTDPENADDTTCVDPDGDGELDEDLNIAFWIDDGDNVLENDEDKSIFINGPISGLGEAGQIALADFDNQTLFNGPVPGGETFYIGKMWCFGTLTPNPVTPADNITPLTGQGTGFTCEGSQVDNAAQTDSVVGDLEFFAVQSRHNEEFLCETWVPDFRGSQPTVGAALDVYDAPACDQTLSADTNPSIQAAIDVAPVNHTICLENGLYDDDTYPLRLDVDGLTLAGVNPPVATAELAGGVIIDNDGVTVTGLKINDSTALSETFGVYVNTGVDNAVVSYNVIVGPDVGTGRGIVNATAESVTGAHYLHNDISNFLTGIFMNPSVGMLAEYNTIHNNGVGAGNDGPDGNTYQYNVIKNNTIEGVGVSDAGTGAPYSINFQFNNIYGNPAGNQMNNYDDSGGFTVDAENNWWGDATDPSDDVNGSGTEPIDFDPFETSAFPEN